MKPENVLLDNDGNIKLADFGVGEKLNGKKAYSKIGTIEYMAPEMFQENGYDFSIDLWAFGCLMYELVNGKPPFLGSEDDQIEYEIRFVDLKLKPEFSKDFSNLLEGLLHK